MGIKKMKISNEKRNENISEFISKNLERPLINSKYIKYYEVAVGENETDFLTPEDILDIIEIADADFSLFILDAQVDVDKLSKDVRKTTDTIIKNVLKPKKKKKKK